MSSTSRLALSDATLREQEAHARKIREVEIRAHASQIVVPTGRTEVRSRLRSLGHPVTLFGEGDAERRARLRAVLAAKAIDKDDDLLLRGPTVVNEGSGAPEGGVGATRRASSLPIPEEKAFYYPATGELPTVRKDISIFSYARAGDRLRKAKRRRESDHLRGDDESRLKMLYGNACRMRTISSQVGGTRAVSTAAFSFDDSEVATGSWDSLCRIWDRTSCECRCILRGHSERVTCVAYRPSLSPAGAGGSVQGTSYLASASVDCTAKLWVASSGESAASNNSQTLSSHIDGDTAMSVDGSDADSSEVRAPSVDELAPVQTFQGHKDRLGRIAWHPNGKMLLTTGFDKTWRMWDVETGSELLMQQGHSRPVYGIAAHGDGSLVATTSLSGHAIIWDIRSGQSIMNMCGHAKPVTGCDFSPNGNLLASCSVDGTVRVWDLRRHGRSLRLIAAHSHVVSTVKFSPSSGEYLVTSGYDSMVKVWSARNFTRLGQIRGNEQLAMDLSISQDEKNIVVCGSDRTWKDIQVAPALIS